MGRYLEHMRLGVCTNEARPFAQGWDLLFGIDRLSWSKFARDKLGKPLLYFIFRFKFLYTAVMNDA